MVVVVVGVVVVAVVVVVVVVVVAVAVAVAVVQSWRNACGPPLALLLSPGFPLGFPLGFPIGFGRHEKEGREGDASEEALVHPDHLP